MTVAKTSGRLGLVVLGAIASSFAAAADTGWYGGLNLGQSRSDFDNARLTTQLRGPGLTTTSLSEDNRDIGYKLFGGYQLNKNFALEGGYFDLGKFSFTATTAPAGTLSGEYKVRGLNLDAVGILPIHEKFSVFGRVGVQYAETRDSFARTGAFPVLTNPSPSTRKANVKFGAGVEYDFTESFGMRVEAERYRIDDAVGNRGNVDLISVGLVYRFGGKAPAPAPAPAFRPAAVTSPPQPVAPPPAPQVVTPPRAVAPQETVAPPPPPVQAPARRDRN